MKKLFICILIIFIFPFIAQADVFNARVIRVYDGDTITVSLSGKEERIRFACIDAPEKKQDYGVESQQLLSSLVLNKNVTIRSTGRDGYGRLIGFVFLDKTNINMYMVQSGAAWVYKIFCKFSVCSGMIKAEKTARRGKLGLWSESSPVPPWKYRKR